VASTGCLRRGRYHGKEQAGPLSEVERTAYLSARRPCGRAFAVSVALQAMATTAHVGARHVRTPLGADSAGERSNENLT
jgi:hypothetical protein